MSEYKQLLENALEQAVQRHFCQLFEVLMVRPDEPGLKRFGAGLDKLAVTYTTLAAKIGEIP